MKHTLKQIIKIAFCCLAMGLLAFIPRDDEPFAKIMYSLQRWTDSIPQEKVYLHMDKPYYALGDTIWFKGYLTVGPRHQLSSLSGAVYVDLINEKDSLLQQLKLPVTSGMVMGNFILGDDLQQGNYRIRAYTQWMRNAGEECFFDHTFLVGDGGGSVIAKADFDYKNNNGKPELSALLNYTNEAGSALGQKDIRFEIRQGKKIFWQQNAKTDALGSLKLNIPDDVRKNPSGAYIHTILQSGNKSTVIRDFPIKSGFSESDVQFFAESGSLVNGINSRMAFKAVGTDGLGVNIKGTVTDNDNKEIAKISTLHAGMGSFLLNPQPGKSYTANITFDDGSTKAIHLPAAADQGYVLSVYQPNRDSILVRIHASANLLQSNLNFIAHVNGDIVFSAPIKIEKPISSIWLSKKSFPSGIAQFTLFNTAGEPLNERIAFIRNNDQMSLDIKTAKAVYKSKERVQLALNAKNSKGEPTFGNFSVSVIDETKIPVDENKESTIFSNILLTSDLKGYVEQPNYYFAQKGEEVDRALDNLMLTQGYRRFTWKELAGLANTKPKFAVEGLGSTISGRVTTLGHRPVANASVILTSVKARVTKLTTTDSLGRFKYDKLFITDSIKFAVQGRNGQSDHVIVEMDSVAGIKVGKNLNWPNLSTNIHSALKPFMDKVKLEDDLYEKLGMLDKVHRLREVNVRAKIAGRTPPSQIAPQGMFKLPDEQSADQLINVDPEEASHYVSLAQYLQGRLQGISVVTGQYGSSLQSFGQNASYGASEQTISLYLNGRRIIHPEEIAEILDMSYMPEDIAKIQVVRVNRAMISFFGGPGVFILTKLGVTRKTYNPSIANISPKGYNKVREFYSPRYDRPSKASGQPDLRTTIYWNPYLKTDVDGNTTFNFFNADGPATYRVVVEGINADGQLGRQVFRYTVDVTQTSNTVQSPAPSGKNLNMITAQLDSFNKRLPMEKVYLHTDKPYYSIGDTLWFKSYLLNGNNLTPSKLSGLLYVELDDDSTEMVRRISIPIKNGMGAGQIPLTRNIFHEGGYTLRAYTNWMQNFGESIVFNQRFYLGVPSENTWLVKSNAAINRVDNKDQLQVDLKLTKANNLLSPVTWRKVEVKIYDEWHYISKQVMQTGGDGSLKFNSPLKDKADGRRVRVQITSLEPADNNMVVQVPLLLNRNQNIDLQFLPEGGKLIAGLKSTVGFKAVSEDGRGVAVSGGIFDNKGKQVLSFTPLHNGMGSFEFTPNAGESYTTRIDQPVAKIFALPKIESTGVVMHISNAEKSDSLKIEIARANIPTIDSDYYLIGMARGVIYYSENIGYKQNVFNISKKLFPSGITRFTLFHGKSPLNERAVFIDNHDQLQISINPDKSTYLKRDSVGLEIMVKDKDGYPVQGNFSLAVTDDSQVKPDSIDNNGITAYLMLRSALKGSIESPGYYINRKDQQAWQALDNLMLTQGWTDYEWTAVFEPIAAKYQPEKEFKVTGLVTNLVNKPINGETVLISSQKPSFITTTTTDQNGRYEFKGLPTIDTGSFFLQAKNPNGKNMSFGNISVDKFRAMPVPETLKNPVLPWYVNTDTVQLNYVKRKAALAHQDDLKLTGHVIKEVQIKGKKIIPNSHSKNGPGGSDLAFDEQDIKKSETTNLYELMQQKLPGLHMGYYRGFPALVLSRHIVVVLIDGVGLPVQLDLPYTVDDLKDEVSKFKIVSFQGMEVNYSEKGTFRYLQPRGAWINRTFKGPEVQESVDTFAGGGAPKDWLLQYSINKSYMERLVNIATNSAPDIVVVDITTKNGNGWYENRAPSVATYRPLPVSYPKQFYSPKYNVVPNVTELDYRSTIFWEPDVTTDQNGRAKVSFYSSDIQSKYTVKIAGIDGNGGLGDASIKLIPKNNNPTMSTLKN